MNTDSDLIARLYPAQGDIEGNAFNAIRTNQQRQQHMRSLRTPRAPHPTARGSGRGAPCLEIRFSDLPLTSLGLVFGRDENSCDVVLPALRGVSRTHFVLTFKKDARDGLCRPVIRDLGSAFGTTVMFDGRGNAAQTNAEWVVGGTDVADTATQIILQLTPGLRFRLEMARHDLESPEYIRNVAEFCLLPLRAS